MSGIFRAGECIVFDEGVTEAERNGKMKLSDDTYADLDRIFDFYEGREMEPVLDKLRLMRASSSS